MTSNDPTPLDPVRLEAAVTACEVAAEVEALPYEQCIEAALRAWEAAAPAPVGEEISRDERLWASAAFGIEEAAVTKYHVVHLVDQIDALWKLAKERLDSLAALRQPAGGGKSA